MIFAGDFAQLPPFIGSSQNGSSVAQYSAPPSDGKSDSKIEQALGRALWHQITTVVILRENMQQRTQSSEDAKLRHALEHMQAKGNGVGPDLSSPVFQHAPIICGTNILKDAINDSGSHHFATDTKQKLESFYSLDTLCKAQNKDENHKKVTRSSKILRPPLLTSTLKETLWNSPASSD
ncbi:hypothetical protein GYMLUDRAFT_183816 [Collybiopsis luxurians FD-317 M1]|uniref:Unplaced genomic scaffold GYMLUscaffold_371, whole genome shotgun sequence n=1 Tax=Collybiopsis luxurians FD-317 M1 TaxID=944289 RepID=A0A0D0C4D4_9AGAR|nr:hypothetical protein GYMLUDRAFT_183816 [Collybiopsis luxurians FD-317 M1]